MRTPITLLVFLAGLAVLFGIAVSLGEKVGPAIGGAPAIPGAPGHGEGEPGSHTHDSGVGALGLAVSDQGYLIQPLLSRFPAGKFTELEFNILGRDGAPVTEYGLTHDRRMHLVVVRRDLTNFQHLHPTMSQEGTWSAQVRFAEPGSYRAFATFLPEGAAEPVTLGVDLLVPGLVETHPIQQASSTYHVDEYTVIQEGALNPGTNSRVWMHVMRGDTPVTDLEPYLGAVGHLVVLREGDLAYLHVHPLAGPQRDTTISFDVLLPSAGFYRMFLEFQHRGEVHLAEFTVVVG